MSQQRSTAPRALLLALHARPIVRVVQSVLIMLMILTPTLPVAAPFPLPVSFHLVFVHRDEGHVQADHLEQQPQDGSSRD